MAMAHRDGDTEPEAATVHHNEALSDDLIAVTAVYGNIIRVTSSSQSYTSVEIRLPYRSLSMIFLLRIPGLYPEESPIFVGLGSFVLSTSKGKHEAIPIFRKSLENVFSPGEPCLLPLVSTVWSEFNPYEEEYVPKVSIRRPPMPSSASLLTETDPMFKSITCTACFDKVPGYDVAVLECKHNFCCDCLQGGLEGMLANKSALTCCSKFIPLNTIKKYCVLPSKELEGSNDWFEELVLPNPVYCFDQSCGMFVPERCFEGADATCLFCLQKTCRSCRKECHSDLCIQDPTLKDYRMKFGWQLCPNCKATVERIDGCKIMSCRCKQEFCYYCGSLVSGHRCSCLNGDFWDRRA